MKCQWLQMSYFTIYTLVLTRLLEHLQILTVSLEILRSYLLVILFTPIFLTTSVRHSGDISWANALNQEIRWGQRFLSKATLRMLESCVASNVSANEISRFKHAIRLFPL